METKVATTKGEVVIQNDNLKNSLEIIVPAGLSHKALEKVSLGELLSKFRPRGCQACLSGQDFRIRERFEKVLPIEINEGGIKF